MEDEARTTSRMRPFASVAATRGGGRPHFQLKLSLIRPQTSSSREKHAKKQSKPACPPTGTQPNRSITQPNSPPPPQQLPRARAAATPRAPTGCAPTPASTGLDLTTAVASSAATRRASSQTEPKSVLSESQPRRSRAPMETLRERQHDHALSRSACSG
eukprot:5543987-Pleurochrysis_carterae.AAC.4